MRALMSASSGTWCKLDGCCDIAPSIVAAASKRSSRSNNAGTLASVMINWGTLPARWNAAIASRNSSSAVSGSPSEVCKRAASRARKPSKNCTRCSRTKAIPSSQAANARRTSALENAIPAIQSA